jgi:hypothetical protein
MLSRARRGPDVDQEHRERRWYQVRDALTCWVGWWACQDLNLGPHPYQPNAGNRCAEPRSRRSGPTVGAKVMRSTGVQVCVLPIRLEINLKACQHCGPHRTPRSAPPPTCIPPQPCYLGSHTDCPILAIRSRFSGSMGWSWSSVPKLICTRAVKALSFDPGRRLSVNHPAWVMPFVLDVPDDGEASDPPAG